MTISELADQTKSERARAIRTRITAWQLSIERHAMQLRAELNLADFDPLEHDQALALIPKCEVWPVKNIPRLPFEHVIHFRTAGYQFGALAFKYPDGAIGIVFNDAHSSADVRVYLMEEFFHIRLGHPPDKIRLYPQNGNHRTYSDRNEVEAFGSGVAALVPYGGLKDMLAAGIHMARIAEHYGVPLPIVEYRISVTQLGHLVSQCSLQMPLLMSVRHGT